MIERRQAAGAGNRLCIAGGPDYIFEPVRIDPHSFADPSQGKTTHVAFDWSVDFDARVLRGSVTLTLDAPRRGPLDLDTRGLTIEAVEDGDAGTLRFELGEDQPVLGRRLRIFRNEPLGVVTIRYTTSPEASALMWLEPSQTASGNHPFLLSQCQAIHARSIAPLQDTPAIRITYDATVAIPDGLSAVMSAAPGQAAGDASQLSFHMPQPIPPYLLAIAVGELDSRDLGPRTRVHAEPTVVDAAAQEFAEVEQMLEAAEGLFGPYEWERYDFIVLPPSFPLGGMENPRMTFLTPTLLAGDRSLVSVLAHELAHSWTGNLITNATNEDFWLNEGWTVYAERRIVEVLYGKEAAAQQARLGRVTLDETLKSREKAGKRTALSYDQAGLDPDGEFSKIPYEKGFLFVSALERAVGRARFDAFIKHYLSTFRFQSLTTAQFAELVGEALPDAAATVDIDAWLFTDGLPADAPTFESERLAKLSELATAWPDDPARLDQTTSDWTTTEALFFLSQLSELDAPDTEALGDWLGLRDTGNAELQCVWLARAAAADVDGIADELTAFVGRVGRTKLVVPVLQAMLEQPALSELARQLIERNHVRWHSSTRLAVATL
jgi:leukotriene-A4 hydrolase